MGKWGYITQKITANLLDTQMDTLTVYLTPGFYDDFALDFGWTTEGRPLEGLWERAEPRPTMLGEALLNPAADAPNDLDSYAFVTDNQGVFFNDADVDGSATRLISPYFDLSSYENPLIRFSYWLTAIEGNFDFLPAGDSLEVYLHTAGDSVLAARFGGPFSGTNSWEPAEIFPEKIIPLTDSVRISFSIADLGAGDFIEAGVDFFRIVEAALLSSKPNFSYQVSVFPNPVTTSTIQFMLDPPAQGIWQLADISGRILTKGTITPSRKATKIPFPYSQGIYLLGIQTDNSRVTWKKLMK